MILPSHKALQNGELLKEHYQFNYQYNGPSLIILYYAFEIDVHDSIGDDETTVTITTVGIFFFFFIQK